MTALEKFPSGTPRTPGPSGTPRTPGPGGLITAVLVMAVVLLVAGSGCHAHSDLMEASNRAIRAAPTDAAQVVFVRPTAWAANRLVTVVDDRGGFVGELEAVSYVVARVRPGRHRFVVWADNTAVLEAHLDAGKTYFVEIMLRAGMWGPGVELLGYGPGRGNWRMLPAWLTEAKRLEPVAASSVAWAREHEDTIRAHTERVGAVLSDYEEERILHTLAVHDGIIGVPFGDDLAPPPASAKARATPTPKGAASANGRTTPAPGPVAHPAASTPASSATAPMPPPLPTPAPIDPDERPRVGRGSPCQSDEECESGLECLQGTCLTRFACVKTAECPTGMRCKEDVCIPLR